MDYKIKSNYLKNQIKNHKFKFIDNILDFYQLAKMKEYILNPPTKFQNLIFFSKLKSEFTEEYLLLLKELDKKTFEIYKDNSCPCPSCDITLIDLFEFEKELIQWWQDNDGIC